MHFAHFLFWRSCAGILHSHVMSSDENTHMSYSNTTRSAIFDMPLAETPYITIGCGLQSQATIFQSRNMCFDHGTDVVRAKDIPRSHSTIREDVSRKQTLSLLIGCVLPSQGNSVDCSICILRTSCFGVLVLASEYAYVLCLYGCFDAGWHVRRCIKLASTIEKLCPRG